MEKKPGATSIWATPTCCEQFPKRALAAFGRDLGAAQRLLGGDQTTRAPFWVALLRGKKGAFFWGAGVTGVESLAPLPEDQLQTGRLSDAGPGHGPATPAAGSAQEAQRLASEALRSSRTTCSMLSERTALGGAFCASAPRPCSAAGAEECR